MSSILLAIKLGSTTTTIFRQGDGLVLREPSLIAISGSIKSREVKAIGYDAQQLVGRSASTTHVISPISNGLVNNSELAGAMLRGFIRKVCPDKLFKPNIRAILCTPIGISLAEKKAFEKVCYSAGISDVTIMPAILCSAIGQNLDIEEKYGKLVVNIGGGCTNIAIIANNTILNGASLSVGGTTISTAIEQYIAEKYHLKISSQCAEKIKNDVGSLLASYSASTDVSGIDLTSKENQTIVITSQEIYPIMQQYFNKICDTIETFANMCQPDIISDVYKGGVHISGSQCSYPGLEKFFKQRLGMPAKISEISKTDIWGASKLLDDPIQLKKILIQL